MKLVVGIDEAGYGPAMGPLIIGASVWMVPDEHTVDGTLERLAPEFRAAPWEVQRKFVPLGDSKKIYRPGTTLDGLKCSLLFWLARSSQQRSEFSEVLDLLAPSDGPRVRAVPWYSNGGSISREAMGSLLDLIDGETLAAAETKVDSLGMRFLGFQMRVFDEPEFNRLVQEKGNKATLLSESSLELARNCIETYGGEVRTVEVYCDRHGGRKRYAPILCNTFNDDSVWFDPILETAECSRYRGTWFDRDLMFQFQVGGDSLYPSAASSIIAKWIREMLMSRLNLFWMEMAGHAIAPTAGYYVDASRFAKEIRPIAERLRYAEKDWWRAC